MQVLTCTVRIEPAAEGGHDVYGPALQGYVAQGESCGEALAMAHEAIDLVEAVALGGEPVPPGELAARPPP
jgi:predicted RNase H-like HicB family nuclease